MCISTEQEVSGCPLGGAEPWGVHGVEWECRGPWVRLYVLRVKWRLAA